MSAVKNVSIWKSMPKYFAKSAVISNNTPLMITVNIPKCQNNHWAGDKGQHGANEQVYDAVYHGDDADFVPVARKCNAGNERKCREDCQARNQPLQYIAPQCL